MYTADSTSGFNPPKHWQQWPSLPFWRQSAVWPSVLTWSEAGGVRPEPWTLCLSWLSHQWERSLVCSNRLLELWIETSCCSYWAWAKHQSFFWKTIYFNVIMWKAIRPWKEHLTGLPSLLRLECVVVTVLSCDLVFVCKVFCGDAHRDFDVQVGQTSPQSVLQLSDRQRGAYCLSFWGSIKSCFYGNHKGPCTFIFGEYKVEEINQKPTFRSNPNFVPKRMLRAAYGAWLIFSEPPHSTTSDSFRQISCKHTK